MTDYLILSVKDEVCLYKEKEVDVYGDGLSIESAGVLFYVGHFGIHLSFTMSK